MHGRLSLSILHGSRLKLAVNYLRDPIRHFLGILFPFKGVCQIRVAYNMILSCHVGIIALMPYRS